MLGNITATNPVTKPKMSSVTIYTVIFRYYYSLLQIS